MLKTENYNFEDWENSRSEFWREEIFNSKVEVIGCEMEEEMLIKVLRISLRTFITQQEILAQSTEETESRAFTSIAKAIKSNLNIALKRQYNWQLIIGRSYGSLSTNESGVHLFFKFAGVYITIFSSN